MSDLLISKKTLIALAAFLLPVLAGGLVMWGQIQERQTAVEKQLDNIAVPDTAELRERLAAVEEKAFNIGKQVDSLESWAQDQIEFINEDIESVLKDPFNNPLEGNY